MSICFILNRHRSYPLETSCSDSLCFNSFLGHWWLTYPCYVHIWSSVGAKLSFYLGEGSWSWKLFHQLLACNGTSCPTSRQIVPDWLIHQAVVCILRCEDKVLLLTVSSWSHRDWWLISAPCWWLQHFVEIVKAALCWPLVRLLILNLYLYASCRRKRHSLRDLSLFSVVALIVVLISVDYLLFQFESFRQWLVFAVLELMFQCIFCQSHLHDRHWFLVVIESLPRIIVLFL